MDLEMGDFWRHVEYVIRFQTKVDVKLVCWKRE